MLHTRFCRVKAVQTLRIALPAASGRSSTTIVTTVSSDGKIRVYDMYSIPATSESVVEIQPVAEYDTKGTRLTCVTVADSNIASGKPANGKRKHEEGSDEDTENDEFDGIGPGDEGDEGEEDEDEGEEDEGEGEEEEMEEEGEEED